MTDPYRSGVGLLDGHGRVHTDLRLSLTDRCNLRCRYCMPAEGIPWTPAADLLTDDELVRLVALLAGLGVQTVRLTGGEPTLRPHLAPLVHRLSELGLRLALTTNGLRLAGLAAGLAAAGLRRVNVSLDTLRADRFRQLARRDGLAAVLAGLAAARDAGLAPVKVNAVLLAGINDDEAVPLLHWAIQEGYQLRFIEQMPLDPGGAWSRDGMVTAAQILDQLGAAFRLTPAGTRGAAPAETWIVDGGPATVGVIGSVTRPFCRDCNRIRLTADGALRNCLFAREETDLRGPLRAGASDAELVGLIEGCVAGKRAGHGIDDPGFLRPARPMSAIGG
ncbi:MAG: GTP 3',8-cyclase MoaA [Mycobacteriales bacterium]